MGHWWLDGTSLQLLELLRGRVTNFEGFVNAVLYSMPMSPALGRHGIYDKCNRFGRFFRFQVEVAKIDRVKFSVGSTCLGKYSSYYLLTTT